MFNLIHFRRALARGLVLFLVAGMSPEPVAAADVPAIAAASDLRFALAEITDAFRRETGLSVRVALGASGTFTQQIENGAPFELFLSADEAYIERLAANGFARDAGVVYAVGRIVLFVPKGSPLKPDATLADLKAALADGRLKRFAIANPDHAPYGRAAREVLQHAGLWERIAARLVLGENAAQAMQFAASGATEAAIVPHALAQAPEVAAQGTSVLLPVTGYRPLRQRMVLIKGAGSTAQALYRFVQQPPARALLAKHGFELPEPR